MYDRGDRSFEIDGHLKRHKPFCISVFDAQEELAPKVTSKKIVEQRSAAATYMQVPCERQEKGE